MNHADRKWRIRPYQKGDEQQILLLRRIVFGDIDPVRLKPSTWRWQFKDNPAGEALCLLAEDKGTIVGQYAAIPTRFIVNGAEAVFAMSCDTMVHPDYRGQGMFVALAGQLYRNIKSENRIAAVWGFPNDISFSGFAHKLGWNMIETFPLRISPIRPVAMISSRFPIVGRLAGASFFSKKRGPAKPVKQNICGLVIEQIKSFGEEFDELWNSGKDLFPVMQVRDRAYLNWRYSQIQEFDYRIFAVRRGNRLAGYMVIRLVNLMGYYFGALVDIFPFPVINNAVTKRLFCFARDYCRACNAGFLTTLLPRAKGSFMTMAGFIKIPEKINPRKWHFGYRCIDKKMPLLDRIGNWHITYGDTDII